MHECKLGQIRDLVSSDAMDSAMNLPNVQPYELDMVTMRILGVSG